MSFGNTTFSDAGGAVNDILGGQATARGLNLKAQGDIAEAGNYDMASELAHDNSEFTKQSTAVKEAQTQREIYLGLGKTTADVAGAGFTMGGSGLDIMRMGASQGALTEAVAQQQGLITEHAYDVQSDSYRNMSEAARFAASEEQSMASDAQRNGYITGGIKGAAALATLFV